MVDGQRGMVVSEVVSKVQEADSGFWMHPDRPLNTRKRSGSSTCSTPR